MFLTASSCSGADVPQNKSSELQGWQDADGREKVDSFEFIEMGDYPFLARVWTSTSLKQLCRGETNITKKAGKHYPDS